MAHQISITLPPGPLGVGIRRSDTGQCYINSKTNASSPLLVGDIIVKMNGIVLADVQDGTQAWPKLFQAFASMPKNLIVLRRIAPSVRTAVAAPPAPMIVAPINAAPKALDKPLKSDLLALRADQAKKPPAPMIIAPNNAEPKALDKPLNSDLLALRAEQAKRPPPAPMIIVPDNAAPKALDKPLNSDLLALRAEQARKPPPPVNKKKHALKASSHGNTTTKTKKTKTIKGWSHDDNYMKLLRDGFPEYGRVSPCGTYYISKDNDTTRTIATTIGLEDWKVLNDIEFNRRFYTKLTGNMLFKQGTVVKIPTNLCSKWKLDKAVDNHVEQLKAMATCSKCLKKEQPGDRDEMLLCDGCDVEIHVSCAGLTKVPNGDWLCESCLQVLEARRKANNGNMFRDANNGIAKPLPGESYTDYMLRMDQVKERDANGNRSLIAKLPPLPPLDAETTALAKKADRRFREEVTKRKDEALRRLMENQRVLEQSSKERVSTLTRDIQRQTSTVEREKQGHNAKSVVIFSKYGLRGWSVRSYGKSHIHFRDEDGTEGTVYREITYQYTYRSMAIGRNEETKCPDWDRYYGKFQSCSAELEALSEKVTLENAQDELSSLEQALTQAKDDENERPSLDEEDRKELLRRFASLLSEPQLEFEMKRDYQDREGFKTMFLGVVKIEEADIRVLNMLKEPTELVVSIPAHCAEVEVEVLGGVNIGGEVTVGAEYYLFGTSELFCPKRNDLLPVDFSPTSMRSSQRDLIAMLLRDQRNHALQVTSPSVPSSVCLRGQRDEDKRLGDIMKCFELGELVRDCHYPIEDMPSAETPKRLADNGLVLRDYQRTSLQWLLDKESNPTGMGSHGELWSRMRGLNGSGSQTWYFCDVTGSIVRKIFDYNTDVGQGDAAPLRGDSFPSCAIIGSEMGLGKTVIALALVVASPPALQNRVLPREHLAKIKHPAYLLPPSVKSFPTDRTSLLSNGSLVIAPLTLCPQWQMEIKRFAPWLSVLTLHNEENNSAADIASKDIVVISTFMLANQRGKTLELLMKLRKIHFHRIFLDESHLNNRSSRSADNSRDTNNTRLIKSGLAQLSGTHRYCVTGTPVGQSLADLYGQLRFLRVPEFCREDFWSVNIERAYEEHNCSALTVLRSLLSRLVIRHSKEQTVGNSSLLALPPRTVETLLLPFATKAEQEVYSYIEKRNTQRFKALRSSSPAAVMENYTELNGLLVSGRQACAGIEALNLDDLQNLNEKREREKRYELEGRARGHRHLEELAEEKKGKKNKTMLEILSQAVEKARYPAKARMRELALHLQSTEIEFIECPICMEVTTESDLALTPCAHKFCAECILSCLTNTSTTREASGKCPECREKLNRSELTFLGDAIDAKKQETCQPDLKPKAKDLDVDINGFHLSTTDKLVAASGAGDRRIAYSPLTEDDKRKQQANLYTLPSEFLAAWNVGYNQLGTKTARLIEEINGMIRQDSNAKAVVFSQYLGTYLHSAAEY